MADTNVKMPDKEELLRQEEELEKKNKAMYPVIITVLCLIFAVGFIYGIRLLLNMEGTFPPSVLTEGKTPVPQTNEELADYLNGVVEAAVAAKPKTDMEWKFRVNNDSVTTDGSESLKNTLLFLIDPAEDAISDGIEKRGVDYGEDMSTILWKPNLTAADIESFTCDYIYYRCKSCGQTSAEPVEKCDVCGSDYPYLMHYKDNYGFTVVLKNDAGLAARLFTPNTNDVVSMIRPEVEPFAALSDIQSEITGLSIRFETNRATDELKNLIYHKDVSASADVLVRDIHLGADPADCSADLTEESVFTFTWPAVVLNRHELTLAPGKREQITAERICDDPKAYTITWTSSDESVVTVDKKGYVKAGKLTGDEPGKATVTASFEFDGKTYSDSCEVTVKVSVEYIQLNRHKLTLNAGETETLIAKVASDNKGFAMKKPTVQTVSWFTTDESVATVDENGTVTAVAPGTATVYALSDDEYYRSSCEVTVK
ncbi:MAG: Ig domain-containing protein [Clostridia bacterium]|nr:Ig domain-containing protein [Clostridia bacterium]